jgi:hypothetical protein
MTDDDKNDVNRDDPLLNGPNDRPLEKSLPDTLGNNIRVPHNRDDFLKPDSEKEHSKK